MVCKVRELKLHTGRSNTLGQKPPENTILSFQKLVGIRALFLCYKMMQSHNTILIAHLADQSEHTGLIRRGVGLKDTGALTDCFRQRVKDKKCFWNIEECTFIFVEILVKEIVEK